VAPGNKLVMGGELGMFFFDPATGALSDFCRPEIERPGNRGNDGAADSKGRFWFGTMQQNIATTQSNLRSQEQNLAELLAHAADLERSGKPVPAALRARLADQRKNVADERNEIAHLQSEREAAAKQQEAELQRYRMLSAKAQAGASN